MRNTAVSVLTEHEGPADSPGQRGKTMSRGPHLCLLLPPCFPQADVDKTSWVMESTKSISRLKTKRAVSPCEQWEQRSGVLAIYKCGATNLSNPLLIHLMDKKREEQHFFFPKIIGLCNFPVTYLPLEPMSHKEQ